MVIEWLLNKRDQNVCRIIHVITAGGRIVKEPTYQPRNTAGNPIKLYAIIMVELE